MKSQLGDYMDKDVKKSTYTFDDSIVFDRIDEILKNVDSSVLDNEDDLLPEERKLVDNGDYEEYNFEEEELEDDDYYNEDLD